MIEESENIKRLKIKLRNQEELITKDKCIRSQEGDKSDNIFKIADKALSVVNKIIGLNIQFVELVLTILKNDVKYQFQIVHQLHELQKIKNIEHGIYNESRNFFINLNAQANMQQINLIIRFYVRLSQKLYSKFMVYAKNKRYLKFISFNYIQLYNFRQELNKFQNVKSFVFFCEIIQFIIKQNELLFDFLLNLIINNELVTSVEQYYKIAENHHIIINHQQNQSEQIKSQLLKITPKKIQLPDDYDFRNYYEIRKGNFQPNKKQKKSIEEIINNLTYNMQKSQEKITPKLKTRISLKKEILINKEINAQFNNENKQSNQQLQYVRKQLIRISQTLKQKSFLMEQLSNQEINQRKQDDEQEQQIQNVKSSHKITNNIDKVKKFRIKKQNFTHLIGVNQNQLNRSKDFNNKKFFIISPNHSNKMKKYFQPQQISPQYTKKLFPNQIQKTNYKQKKLFIQTNPQKHQQIKPNIINKINNTLYLSKNRNILTQSSHSQDHKLIFEKYKQYLYPLLPCFTQQNNLTKKNKEIIFSKVNDFQQLKENFFQNSNNSCRFKSNQQETQHLTSKYNQKNRKWTQNNHKIFEIFNPRQSKIYK